MLVDMKIDDTFLESCFNTDVERLCPKHHPNRAALLVKMNRKNLEMQQFLMSVRGDTYLGMSPDEYQKVLIGLGFKMIHEHIVPNGNVFRVAFHNDGLLVSFEGRECLIGAWGHANILVEKCKFIWLLNYPKCVGRNSTDKEFGEVWHGIFDFAMAAKILLSKLQEKQCLIWPWKFRVDTAFYDSMSDDDIESASKKVVTSFPKSIRSGMKEPR